MFIRDKVYTGTMFIRGQSLYWDKVYTGTKFIRGQSLFCPGLKEIMLATALSSSISACSNQSINIKSLLYKTVFETLLTHFSELAASNT